MDVHPSVGPSSVVLPLSSRHVLFYLILLSMLLFPPQIPFFQAFFLSFTFFPLSIFCLPNGNHMRLFFECPTKHARHTHDVHLGCCRAFFFLSLNSPCLSFFSPSFPPVIFFFCWIHPTGQESEHRATSVLHMSKRMCVCSETAVEQDSCRRKLYSTRGSIEIRRLHTIHTKYDVHLSR